jgi:hypothetical protein
VSSYLTLRTEPSSFELWPSIPPSFEASEAPPSAAKMLTLPGDKQPQTYEASVSKPRGRASRSLGSLLRPAFPARAFTT